MLLLGNCEPFVMCYNVQVCIVKQPGVRAVKDAHSNEVTHSNAEQDLFNFNTFK